MKEKEIEKRVELMERLKKTSNVITAVILQLKINKLKS